MYIPENKKEIVRLIQRYEMYFHNREYTIREITNRGKRRSRTELIGWLAKFN